ncbi:MFS transporter [Candidatus Uhrbacteria bacterium]|nr:MFS transporter [Candidatus Uhrbacteria bacterium]
MRYGLNAGQHALGDDNLMSEADFYNIFAWGAASYVIGFLTLSPLVDRKGGRWGMITGLMGTISVNLIMALVVRKTIDETAHLPFVFCMTALYCANMFFQSLGAMSIVAVNVPWFHVRERGKFATIFGVLIALGNYFAFDWGYAIVDATRKYINLDKLSFTASIFQGLLGTGGKAVNESWWLFLFPALFGLFWLIPIVITLRNSPKEASFNDFETGIEHMSASQLTMFQMLKEVFLNPKHRVVLVICLIEFCSGAIRNGSIQTYPKFAEHIGFKHDFALSEHWGLFLLIAGVIGANATGFISDKCFNSRRGPMAVILYVLMVFGISMILFSLGSNAPHSGSINTGIGLFILATCVIGVHGILSGTAAAEFSGTKNTAKAVGIIDGAVYLGTSAQSFLMGLFVPIFQPGALAHKITDPSSWMAWPIILLPFAVIGTILGTSIYSAYPKGKHTH